MRWAALAAAAFGVAAVPASAATYVVSPSGNDSNNGVTAPFRSLGKALSAARSGDTVALRTGTYAGGLTLSQPGVTLASYPGEVAAIATAVGGTAQNTLTLSPAAIGTHLSRLKIIGGTYYSLKIDGNKRNKNTLIEDCVIGQSGQDCVKITPGADGVTFRRCEIGHSGLAVSNNAEGIDNVCADDMVVQDCWIHDIATNGIYPKGGARNAVIERTRIERCGVGGVMLGFYTDLEWFDRSENPHLYENIDGMVRNCVIVNTRGAGIGCYAAQNPRVYNNTLVNVGQSVHPAIVINPGETGALTQNLRFINNVVVQSAGASQPMIGIRDGAYQGPIHCSNNRYCKMGGKATFKDSSWTGGLAQWQSRRTTDSDSLDGDPKLDGSNVPAAGSSCIAEGFVLADVRDDFKGVLRTGTIDIGAFQTASTTPPPPPPPADGPPATPTGLSATPNGTARVDLRWTASGSPAGFRIYRREGDAGDYNRLAGVAAPGTTFGDAKVTAGATYSYEVSAIDASGRESAPTAPVSATISQAPEPAASSVIYDDALQGGWTARQARASVSLRATSPVAEGDASIALTITGKDGYLLLSGDALSTVGKTALKFKLHGGAKGGQTLRVRALVGGVQKRSVNLWSYGGHPRKGGWVECVVPLSALGATGSDLTGIKYSAGNPQKRATLDYIRLE